tara:strand:- start:1062 stop:1916 length:855 start_codon:yes stop_codon:yes gene_type:complete
MKNLHIVSIFVILLLNCSLLTTKSNTNKINADSHINQGNAYWGKRASPKSAKLAVLFYKKAFELNQTDLILAASLSKAFYFQAYYVESDLSKRDTLYLKGAESALRGFENSTFYQSFSDTTKFENNKMRLEAIKKAPIETIGVLFWWVNNQGKFLINKPVIDRIGSREILEVAMHRISTLDEDYYYGGPTRFFGMFYSRLPGVPLDRAKLNFDQSLLDNPNFFGTRVLRARYYHTKLGNRELFEEDLKFVINGDPSLLPDAMPENLFEQEKAKELLNNTTILFE